MKVVKAHTVSTKAKLGWIGTVIGLFLLAVAAYQSSPPPYQPSFGLADKQQLETLYPGGKFIGNDIYQRCEQGWQVKYYPDGRRLSFGTCWK